MPGGVGGYLEDAFLDGFAGDGKLALHQVF
jgi:hypothetical protein